MYNSTQVIQIITEQGLTDFQQYSRAFEIAVPMLYFLAIANLLTLILIGLIGRVEYRGKRKMLLLQPNYALTVLIAMVINVVLVAGTHLFPFIPFAIDRWLP